MPFEQKTDRFSKQEFILTVTNPSSKGVYTDYIRFQCINEKTQLIEDMQAGDFVVIKFSITGRKFKNKKDEEIFYTNLDVEDLEIVNKGNEAPKEIKAGQNTDYSDLIPGLDQDDSIDDADQKEYDDLPF